MSPRKRDRRQRTWKYSLQLRRPLSSDRSVSRARDMAPLSPSAEKAKLSRILNPVPYRKDDDGKELVSIELARNRAKRLRLYQFDADERCD